MSEAIPVHPSNQASPQYDGKPSLYETYREVGVVSAKVDSVLENQHAVLKKMETYERKISDLERGYASILTIGGVVALFVSILANVIKVKIFSI
jgi:hypothetical protein